MQPDKYNSWARQILWANALPPTCPVHRMDPESKACEMWVREFQETHGLFVDGLLGPTVVLACAGVYGEGMGGFGALIIGGEKIALDVPVLRLFDVSASAEESVAPDVITLLSIAEVHREARRRVKGQGIRSHFSIDGSKGRDGHSLIIQWADPLRAVSFLPVGKHGDYPEGRAAVGVELENPLAMHYREREGRIRLRQRDRVTATVGNMSARQLGYFPEQMSALDRLLTALSGIPGLSTSFPRGPIGEFLTDCDPERWGTWKGVLARFHYHNRLNEPGASLVPYLPFLFGSEVERADAVSIAEAKAAEDEAPTPERKARPFVPSTQRVIPDLVAEGVPDDVTDSERESLKASWKGDAPSAVKPQGSHRRFSIDQARDRRGGRSSRRDVDAEGSLDGADAVVSEREQRRAALRERLRRERED